MSAQVARRSDATLAAGTPGAEASSLAVLNALPDAVLVLDPDDRVRWLNAAAEQFLSSGMAALRDQPLTEVLPADSPLLGVIGQARRGGHTISESSMPLEGARIGNRLVHVDVAPIPEAPGQVVVTLKERSIARKLDLRLGHRTAARSVTAMASMLAHEVKNPLSGIRGAAQLIELSADAEGAALTRLICEEADRIVALVDQMDSFADDRPIERGPVNIHEALERVRAVACAGFARDLRIVESYDPSLPPVLGNRDLLIQALLNLVKNAAEAMPGEGGEIVLETRYQQGVRLTSPGGGRRLDLPLMVAVRDNGPGISEELRQHLFDPFVSTKPGGRGLGLALVAKVVSDHGGVIECDSEPGRTLFRLLLPVHRGEAA